MRSSKIRLIDLLPLREAEEDAENPFAAGDAGGDAADAGGAEGEEGAEEEPKAKKAAGEEPNIRFNVAAVKKYNNNKFSSDTGKIISADKRGMQVMVLPDEVPIFVNFQDVL